MTNSADETAMPLMGTSADRSTTPAREGIAALRRSCRRWLLLIEVDVGVKKRNRRTSGADVEFFIKARMKEFQRMNLQLSLPFLQFGGITCVAGSDACDAGRE